MSAARDELFALIARIPGSGSAGWCNDARKHLDAYRAEVLREAAEEIKARCPELKAANAFDLCHCEFADVLDDMADCHPKES